MSELNEKKIKALMRLVKKDCITTEDIKDSDYKKEVKDRLNS